MLFQADRPFWKVALGAKDSLSYRVNLEHVLIEDTGEDDADGVRIGRAIAADGFMLVVQTVKLLPKDVPGLVHASRFATAVKRMDKKSSWYRDRGEVWLDLGDESVAYFDKATEPRCTGGLVAGTQYVDYSRVVPSHSAADAPRARLLSFNPTLYATLCAALGELGATILVPGKDENSPVLLETRAPDELGRPVAPYGVLMPMHAKGIGTLAAWEQAHTATAARQQRRAS